MEEKPIEQRVAETILAKEVTVTIGDKKYTAAPPSTATLILVSEAVARLPHTRLDPNNIVGESLSIAKDCRFLGDVAAILLLGARHINDTEKTPQRAVKRYLWGLFKRERTIIREESRKDLLSRELLEYLRPSELNALVAQLLQSMDLGDFFGLTTFLTEINLLRKTKVEEN